MPASEPPPEPAEAGAATRIDEVDWLLLLADARRRAVRYLAGLAQRPVAPPAAAVARLAELDEPLPERPVAPLAVLARLDAVASPATVASAGPRYFGYVIGGALPAAVATSWLVAAWDQDAAFADMSPAAAALERAALAWLLDLLGLPAGSAGAFVTGATAANLTALAAARGSLLARQGWDVEEQGLFAAPPIRVVVGDEAHASLFKALSLLGLGRARVERVPTDREGRMRPDALPALDGATILCLQAGNVNSGASDPFGPLIAEARRVGAWVHVDGAFGLWAAAAPALAPQVEGVAGADSWATDAHKWLNVPYDSGIAFCRHEKALRAAMAATAAAYLPGQQAPERQPAWYTPELSRRARGVEVWAALASLGRSGFVDLLERTCGLARRAAGSLQQLGWEVLNEVVLNQVLVHFRDDATTRETVRLLQREGTCWCGGTSWRGRAAMRISVSSWTTAEEDIDRSVSAMDRAARLAAGLPARRDHVP